MSHNKITVNNQAAASDSNIPLNMNTYITESTPTNNQIIKYDGANWINAQSPSSPGFDLVSGWNHRSGSYSNGNYYYRTNHYHINRKNASTANVYNNGASQTSATSINTPLTSNNTSWFESVSLSVAATYLCMYSLNCPSGTSLDYRWEDHSGVPFGNKVTVHKNSNSWGVTCCGIITTTTTSRKIRVVCQAYSGNVEITEYQEAFASSLTIIKLS